MSAYWDSVTVVEGSAVSTQRAHSVAREKSAVGLATSSLTPMTVKVSLRVLKCPLVPMFLDSTVCVIIAAVMLPLDINECEAGIHNCGPEFECQNTQGSFRCLPKVKCAVGFIQDALGNCIGK